MAESVALCRLAPVPRTITPGLAAHMLLGGAGTQLGWLLLAFGSIFFWIFALNADFSGWRFRAGAVQRVEGRSLGCEKTGYTEGGSEDDPTPVFRNRYSYTAGGRIFQGVSYATGRCESGGTVMVEYLAGQPGFSRIAGMRHGLLTAWAALVAIFPGLGLVMATTGLVKGWRRVRLLREGLPAEGRLIDRTATRSSTNGLPDYRMIFEYTAQNGTVRRVTARTNTPERLEDHPRELLLYDPHNLDRACLIDDLPGSVTIDEAGQPALSGRAHLLVPALTLLVIGWLVYRSWITG